MGGPAGGLAPELDRLLASIRETVRRHRMLAGGETVVIATSGGGDSVALLYLLRCLAPEWCLQLHAVHVDHQLRTDSARDGEFVTRLAARLGIPSEVVTVTVAPEGSPEASARLVRYRALEGCADRLGAQRIAVAHTADDQVETVLMRFLQGTGVRGLAGIPPTRGRIIRPLLAERRVALRSLLAAAGIEWVDDPTNDDRRFLRNRVRHDLLPALRQGYNPAIAEALIRLARLARAASGAVERMAARELARLAVAGPDELILSLRELRALPDEIAAEVLRQGAEALGSRAPLRAWAHRGLRRALRHPSPRRPFRLGALTVELSGEQLRLGRGVASTIACRTVPVPGSLALSEAGLVLESSLGSATAFAISPDRWRVAFDADRLPEPLIVRGRRPGDRLTPFGAAVERRLKRLLIQAKIPRWERGRIPIVQAGSHIAWVGGVRRGAIAPVTPGTRRILQLALSPLTDIREAGQPARQVRAAPSAGPGCVESDSS